jgi:hypothetical protein
MAKTRNFISGLLGRTGNSIFKFLTRLEEKGFMPHGLRWIKVTALGFIASLVVALSLQAEEAQVTCYLVARLPEAAISDVSVSPNPTKGSDSVKVRATAKVLHPEVEDNYIKEAWLSRQKDTLKIPMSAIDGKLSDTLEVLEATFYVGDLDTGQNWFFISVTTSQGNQEISWQSYNVTNSDSLIADSSVTKDE